VVDTSGRGVDAGTPLAETIVGAGMVGATLKGIGVATIVGIGALTTGFVGEGAVVGTAVNAGEVAGVAVTVLIAGSTAPEVAVEVAGVVET
jgi:hypothetical protein